MSDHEPEEISADLLWLRARGREVGTSGRGGTRTSEGNRLMPLQNLSIVARRQDAPLVHVMLLRAAQPDADAFVDLVALVGKFVDYRLSGDDEGAITAVDADSALVTLGCRMVHDKRLGSGMNPSLDDLKAVTNDVNDIYKAGETVLIQCAHGRERTGLVSAAWKLIFGGASRATVMADMAAHGITGFTAAVDVLVIHAVNELADSLGLA